MNFTSDGSQVRSGFEVLVGCPVTVTTEFTSMWPDLTTLWPGQTTVYYDNDFTESFTTQVPTTISKLLCLSLSKTLQVGTFSTSNPYDNNMNMQETFSCTDGQNPEILITRFHTESDYDFLTINFGEIRLMRKW